MLTLSMAAELYIVQDALQALCGLQLLHPSALPTPQVLCMMLTLLRVPASMSCRSCCSFLTTTTAASSTVLVTAAIKRCFGPLLPAFVASTHNEVLYRMRTGVYSQSVWRRPCLRLSATYLLSKAVMLRRNNSLSQAPFLLVTIEVAPVSCSFRLARQCSQKPAGFAVLQRTI